MQINVKLMNEKAKLPQYSTQGSAGMDLFALLETPVTIAPGGRALISTGIAVKLPAETVGLVYARSGLAIKHGLALSNGVGVIDSDYIGEIKVGLVNLSDKEYTVSDGDRIAQLVITPYIKSEIHIAETLEETGRGAGGFGSTGR